MRKIIAVSVLMAFVAVAAMAATPDAWRVRVSDLDKTAPHSTSITNSMRMYSVYPESGSTAGVTVRLSCRDYDAASNNYFMQEAVYTASSGALSYGLASANSLVALR